MSTTKAQAALALAQLVVLKDGTGNVPIHHEAGMVQFINTVDERGPKQTLDSANRNHNLLVPVEQLSIRHNARTSTDHLVYPSGMPNVWNVVRVMGATLKVIITLPAPAPDSLELTFPNGNVVTVPKGETQISRVLQGMEEYIHATNNPLAILSLNANVIYDIANIQLATEVVSAGQLITAQRNIYNWVT